jgi:hypothetical protein
VCLCQLALKASSTQATSDIRLVSAIALALVTHVVYSDHPVLHKKSLGNEKGPSGSFFMP